jgi:hypothetical protein
MIDQCHTNEPALSEYRMKNYMNNSDNNTKPVNYMGKL